MGKVTNEQMEKLFKKMQRDLLWIMFLMGFMSGVLLTLILYKFLT